MRAFLAVLLLCLSALPAKADKCDALAPTNAQNVDENFKGKIEGEIKGVVAKLAGGGASIDGEFRKIETDQLKNYPESDKLYVWQRIIYLACINPDSKIDINHLFYLYVKMPRDSASLLDEIPLGDRVVHGQLAPADEATPPNPCSGMPDSSNATILLMGNKAVGNTGFGTFIPLEIRGCPAIEMTRTPQGVLFSARLVDRDNNRVVTIIDNKIDALNGENYKARQSQDFSSFYVKNQSSI